MMLFTAGEHDRRMGDPARPAHQEERRFARRIDCDSARRPAAQPAPARGGAPRADDTWERSRPGR
ncbi:MAG TPA: hypothetical protein VHG08_08635 [Longimicrobium sp.]|nr:hypothetical protein [Longimicrobium sp.]